MQHYTNCEELKSLIERLRRGSRGIRARGVNVGQSAIKGSMAELFADHKGISAVFQHQHRASMLQDVRVLQSFTKARSLSDCPE